MCYKITVFITVLDALCWNLSEYQMCWNAVVVSGRFMSVDATLQPRLYLQNLNLSLQLLQ